MKRLVRILSIVCRISLAVALTSGLGAGFAHRAQAETKTGHEFIYYNNAAHQTVVGVYVYCTDGASSHWGVITPYDVIEPSDC